MALTTAELSDKRVNRYFKTGVFLDKENQPIPIDVPAKVKEMYEEGITQRHMMDKLNMAQHIISAIRRRLGIDGRNPNTKKDPSELKYGVSPSDTKEYNKRRHAAGFKAKHGYSIDTPRTGMRDSFFDKDMDLYACSCRYCNNEMLWPAKYFSEPSAVHYRKPKKYKGVLERGRKHRTVTCESYALFEKQNENIPYYLYIHKYRDYCSIEGLPLSELKLGRYGKKWNMKNDPLFLEFKKLFKNLKRDENGIYICPVYKTPMKRAFGVVGHTPTSPSVDRIDSSRPHTIDNLQIISWAANNHKGNATLDEMILQGEHAKRLKEIKAKL